MYAGLFDGGEGAVLAVEGPRRLYVHVVRGRVCVNDVPLDGGDALKLAGVDRVEISQGRDAEVLLFDLPGDAAQ